MHSPLNGQRAPSPPIYERIHALEAMLRELRRDMHHESRRIARLEEGLKLMQARIDRTDEARREAVREIERKINGAILWLALGAGGLVLKLISPKLGL